MRQEVWAHRTFGPPTPAPPQGTSALRTADTAPAQSPRQVTPFPASVNLDTLPEEAHRGLISVAQGLLGGRFDILGTLREDMADPTWSLDPLSGQSYPDDRCAFQIDFRSAADPRNVKQVWELSRHHHLTVLGLAWRLTGDDRYADMAARHLRSWWKANPVLRGVNWSSGIELGIRLISWVWTRRLLDGWPGASTLFEENGVAVHQIYWHQRYLAAFRSRGSSANNHVVAEAAGQLVTSCAFPWFAESPRWRDESTRLLEEQLLRNTFSDGLNREQAFDYHGLVAELGLVAAVEAEWAGTPIGETSWILLCSMLDVTASVLDRAGHAPRYGDSDDGRALVLADPAADRWSSLLAVGAAVFGSLPWWPPVTPDAESILLAGLVGHTVDIDHRPEARRSHYSGGGLTILRSPSEAGEEIWCRCDAGPHGFLSIAAHAHADALSIELHHDGVELLVDPGTYCYHGEPAWRRYFRSTIAHNTLDLDAKDQSESGGPFLWVRQARTNLLEVQVDRPGVQRWSAEHDGYGALDPPARHQRTVTLDCSARSLDIVDHVTSIGSHRVRLAFHLGPAVRSMVDGSEAILRWVLSSGDEATAALTLPDQLAWSMYRGSTDPVLGWYSPSFGRRMPTTTLVGSGLATESLFHSRLQFTS